MDPLYIGIFGSALFMAAWAYELYEELFRHKIYTDLKFAYLNIVGISAIIVYSYMVNSQLFFYLNIILFIFVALEICITFHLRKKSRKRSK